MSLSQITLSGTIKENAEQKTTTNGNSVISFMMMVLRYDSRAKEEKSYPVKVNMWGETFADQLTQLTAGTRVIVTGRLQLDQFNDRNGKMVRLAVVDANKVASLKDLANASSGSSRTMSDPYSDMASSSIGSETDALSSEEVPF